MPPEHAPESRRRRWLTVGYPAGIVAAVVAYLVIRQIGEGLKAPNAPWILPPPGADGNTSGTDAFHVLLALAAILAASRGVGMLFQRLRQPSVIGELLAGILLGPSLLGMVAPAAYEYLFPQSIAPLIGVVAQIGVLLFMFLVGLELDTKVLREEGRTTFVIAHAGIAAPFILGSLMALWLYPQVSDQSVSFTAFSLFVGISLSVTAFPVLARILQDRGMQHSHLGSLALTAAAVADVTAWCLLALVVGVIQSDFSEAGRTTLFTIIYLAAMVWGVRPAVKKLVARFDEAPQIGPTVLAGLCLMLLLSSLATEFIGIHTLFGAFLMGAIIPHESRVAKVLQEKLHDVVVVLFLPAFFAFSGLRTRIDLIGGHLWLLCAVIIAVACIGKIAGTALAARACGMKPKEATSLGVLMNTRGLMELIVLNIGLDLKVISPTVFAMLVLMALVTTFATSPLLDLLTSTRRASSVPAEAAAPSL